MSSINYHIYYHILAFIISNHGRRRELLYDIIHQERLNDDLEYLEMSITHTDVDDNSIPNAFDLTLVLLDHHITKTSRLKSRIG